MQDWVDRIRQGERRKVARAISWIENGDERREPLLKALFPYTGKACLIGVTGAPGAGKSTLVDELVSQARKRGKKVGVIAVDPTSPFTGGALLGDRVRMTRHALDAGVYIRSMGTRGHLGGLARAAKEATRVLDAAGMDVIFIETVGVGQSEIDIMHLADTVALVLTPGSGDAVQVFKAGIMETADLFVINKADMDGTKKLVHDVEEMLHLAKSEASWHPPICETISKDGRGMEELWTELTSHLAYLKESGEWETRRFARLRREVQEIMGEELSRRLQEHVKDPAFQRDLDEVQAREQVPHEVARRWLARLAVEGGDTP
ncbi:methylmalonyl Co-A mutase-associated GTPase MeaB [Marininema halotolerans]|uniref:LAO/AO transport system kinase n=1 Tax=Marininema halotolerans TaxID=1155944 RepID=A0A1I6P5A8_9BACL|nr:methylmalonyl Co-A mutase-associated GTPase MeaB [Marininema halotolerans]SFS35359.1 LAO/AO transport system kinase [Marininema halotolerans]